MDELGSYVMKHTDRGECGCGKCIDVGNKPDPQGHTADLVFFRVAARNAPDAETFKRLSATHKGYYGDVDPFDGKDHNYLELGGWIGDQGLAMQYMGLGCLLGVFKLFSPAMLVDDRSTQLQLAGMGMLSVRATA